MVLAIMLEGAVLAPVAHSKNQFNSNTKIRAAWLHNVGVLQRNVVWDSFVGVRSTVERTTSGNTTNSTIPFRYNFSVLTHLTL